jgi:ribose/xylose/arabinose/galactoside ABC-type transport system permease subunit
MTDQQHSTSASSIPNEVAHQNRFAMWGHARRWLGIVGPTFGIFAVVLLLGIAGTLLHERFLHPINIRNIVAVATPIAILGLGMAFVLFAGEIDLSVGSTLSIASVILGTFMARETGMIVPVALLALAAGAAVGVVNGLLVAYIGVPSFIATLATLLVVAGINFLWTKGGPRSNLAPEFRLLSEGRIDVWPISMIVLVVVVSVIAWIITHRTRFGRQLMIVGSNAVAARIAGVDVARVKLGAFMLSGMFAAIAGMFVTARVGSAQSDVGRGMELDAIAAAVLGGISLFGGRGHVLSAVGGALVLGILFNLLILLGLPTEAQLVTTGVVVVAAVLLYSRMAQMR